jgi:hypothetical protein
VPKLTPVVFPKLNEEPDPAVVVEPLLFRYTDFGAFGEVVLPLATCVPVDPVALTVAPGLMLVQVGVEVPLDADKELERVASRFKSKSVEETAENVTEMDLLLVIFVNVYPLVIAVCRLVKFGEAAVESDVPSMRIDSTS